MEIKTALRSRQGRDLLRQAEAALKHTQPNYFRDGGPILPGSTAPSNS